MIEQNKKAFENFSQEAARAQKDGLDALIQSSTIALKGSESLFKGWADLVREATERNAEGFKALLSAKTLNELAEVQTRLVQGQLDHMLQGTARLSELGVRVATEAFEPINDQVTRTTKKATKAA